MLLSAVLAFGLLASVCAREEPLRQEDAIMMDWGSNPETWQELLRQFDYPSKDTLDSVKKIVR